MVHRVCYPKQPVAQACPRRSKIDAIPGARLDHVGIAVRSIETALGFYRDVLGGVPGHGSTNRRMGFRFLALALPGGGKLELLEPTGDDSFLISFLERRGEGVHHLTLIVPDIQAAIAVLRDRGYEPIQVRLDNPAWQEAFVHPRETHGVVIQLVQTTREMTAENT